MRQRAVRPPRQRSESMPELKTETLMIRLTPAIKKLAIKRAAAERRSLAGYIARLIEEDAKRH